MSLELDRTAVVISPHQDDVLISMGQFLMDLYKKKIILDIFTQSNSTMDEVVSTQEVTQARAQEEKAVSDSYQIDIRSAGLPDSELRGVSWDDHLATVDRGVLHRISEWLIEELSVIEGELDIFIPAAFGLHPDHYLTLLSFVTERLLKTVRDRATNIFLYGEQPYLQENKTHHAGHRLLEEYETHLHAINPNDKRRMLQHYPSQLTEGRVENLANLPNEYLWKLSSEQLSEYLQASLKREGAGHFSGFNDVTWLENVKQSFQKDNREFIEIIVINDEGINITVPIVIDRMQLESGKNVLFARFAGVYTSDYFETSIPIDVTALNNLKNQLQRKGVDALWLSNIRVDSLTGATLTEDIQSGSAVTVPNIPTVGLYCDLSYHDWLSKKSKNMRRNAKRKWQKLNEHAQSLDESLSFSVNAATPATIQQLLVNQEQRALQTGKDAFNQSHDFSAFITSLSDHPNVMVGELMIGDDVLASLLFLQDKDQKTLAFYMQSFDSKWEEFSPSFNAILKLVEYAHSEGFLYLDFLRGEEDYKQHFVDHQVDMMKYIYILSTNHESQEVVDFIAHYEE